MDTDSIPLQGQILTGAFTSFDATICILLIFFILCSAMASASEVAYLSLTPNDLKTLKDKGHKKALKLQDKLEQLLATILIFNSLMKVGITLCTAYLVDSLLDFGQNPMLILIAQIIVIAFFILIICELIPKQYADKQQIKIAASMSILLTILTTLFKPLAFLLTSSTSIISKRLNPDTQISIDQLSKALERDQDPDIDQEKEIFKGIVRFGNIDAMDIICPRINVIAIDVASTFKEVKETITEHGYSRLPVYDDNLDNITGILYVKDLLQHLGEADNFKWQQLVRPAYFIPENKKINDLLEELQHEKVHMAIVVDEYGGTTGIITMEDIIEEIVGDIQDEYDEQEIVYTQDKEGSYVFEASTLLNDFYKITDTDEEAFEEVEGDADTLAGLILEIKGELPQKDEIITYHEHQFKILEVDNRRIKKIKYRKLTPTEEEKGNSENTENTDTK